jgi:hypothetical protein
MPLHTTCCGTCQPAPHDRLSTIFLGFLSRQKQNIAIIIGIDGELKAKGGAEGGVVRAFTSHPFIGMPHGPCRQAITHGAGRSLGTHAFTPVAQLTLCTQPVRTNIYFCTSTRLLKHSRFASSSQGRTSFKHVMLQEIGAAHLLLNDINHNHQDIGHPSLQSNFVQSLSDTHSIGCNVTVHGTDNLSPILSPIARYSESRLTCVLNIAVCFRSWSPKFPKLTMRRLRPTSCYIFVFNYSTQLLLMIPEWHDSNDS